MVNHPVKVHLFHKGGAACGQATPWRTTKDPAGVTCVPCSKTIHMADAEIQSRTSARQH